MSKTQVFKSVLLFAVMISAMWAFAADPADTGIIRGTVIEDATGEPLFSANVQVVGMQAGAVTDFDGNFEISLPPGDYDLKISFLGLKSVTISGVHIEAGAVEAIDLIRLSNGGEELDEVIVTAEAIKNTESALITMRAKSASVMDGISAQTFKKIGDGDAASAVKRVPGVSVQEGKYVFVRGLGDRYTKTTLHGMDVPGLDPDRNSLQMDIFPTSIISSIVVRKSFTADMPADFTGGVVNIETKTFPEKPVMDVSAGVGYTPGMHFNSDYRTYNGGSLDFLGFDDGSRSEPLNMGPNNPAPTGVETDPRLKPNPPGADGYTREFNNEMGTKTATSPMNFDLGLSTGNQIKKDDKTYGWMGSLTYKNNTTFYDDWEQNFYRKSNQDPSITELRTERLSSGVLGINNVLMSGLIGGAMKTMKSKYKVNIMHLQNGESKSGFLDQSDFIVSNNEQVRHNLEYSERSITNALISGQHLLEGGDWELEWNVSPTYSRINDKDVRITSYLVERDADGNITRYSIDASEAGFPQRIWRNLDEFNIASRADVKNNHRLFGEKAKLTMGLGYVFKQRDYSILNYELRTLGNPIGLSGDGDELMSDEFLWSQNNPNAPGTFIHGQYQANNTFSGTQSTISLYASEEFNVTSKLKTVLGLRLEKYDQFYTGQNQIANTSPNDPAARIFDNENVLDLFQVFPTVNMIYALTDNSNLRGSWFMTTARPSFKEISTAEIVDVLSGMTFIGNVDLVQTDIQNMDIRYEAFFNRNQMFSVSGFYKTFVNPIEMISFEQDITSFQPRNVGDARVLGIEIEGRVNLSTVFAGMEAWSLNANVSLIDARVTYDKTPGGDYDGKQNGLREGETLDDYRDMQGQAPYIVNAGVSYRGEDNGFEAGLFYNVQGPKLVTVGINYTPDVYSVPFHSLNFNLKRGFGENKKYQVGLSVDNILDDVIETETRSFGTDPSVFSRWSPRRTIGLSFSYKFQ
jgi:outer membrane receptor for ferrienterochelin and colicin